MEELSNFLKRPIFFFFLFPPALSESCLHFSEIAGYRILVDFFFFLSALCMHTTFWSPWGELDLGSIIVGSLQTAILLVASYQHALNHSPPRFPLFSTVTSNVNSSMPIPSQLTPLRNAMFTPHLSLRTEPLCQSWGGKGQQPASLGANALFWKWAPWVMKGSQ